MYTSHVRTFGDWCLMVLGPLPRRTTPPEDVSPGGRLSRRTTPPEDVSPAGQLPRRTSPRRTTPPQDKCPVLSLLLLLLPAGVVLRGSRQLGVVPGGVVQIRCLISLLKMLELYKLRHNCFNSMWECTMYEMLGVMIFRFKKLPFPFGKIVNSVSKDFLNGNSVWPLTLYTKIPFTNQIKKKYELRIRVLSTALCIVKATVTLHVRGS